MHYPYFREFCYLHNICGLSRGIQGGGKLLKNTILGPLNTLSQHSMGLTMNKVQNEFIKLLGMTS